MINLWKIDVLSDEELLALYQEILLEIQRRDSKLNAIWVRCPRCNGTGKHPGGYCVCVLGRDLERVECGRHSSYSLPPPDPEY